MLNNSTESLKKSKSQKNPSKKKKGQNREVVGYSISYTVGEG